MCIRDRDWDVPGRELVPDGMHGRGIRLKNGSVKGFDDGADTQPMHPVWDQLPPGYVPIPALPADVYKRQV